VGGATQERHHWPNGERFEARRKSASKRTGSNATRELATREDRSRLFSRLSGPYPRGRCRERGYVAERPRACRGLSAVSV